MRSFLQNTAYIHFANPSEALAKIDLMQKCIFAMQRTAPSCEAYILFTKC